MRARSRHLANPYFFLSSVYAYKLTGAIVGFALALVLPFLQIVIACCLLGRIFVPAALGIAALLFAAYSAAQGSCALARIERCVRLFWRG